MSDLVLENTIKCMVENRDRTDRFQIKKKNKKKVFEGKIKLLKELWDADAWHKIIFSNEIRMKLHSNKQKTYRKLKQPYASNKV